MISTPLLRAEQGVGKGFLVESLLAELLGCESVAVCDVKDLTGDFNDVIEGKTLLLLDEVYRCSGSRLNSLKSMQGNSTITLRRKHKPALKIKNHLNFIMASNVSSPFTIEAGDRRYWVPRHIKHKVNVTETSVFINSKLKPWLENSGGFGLVRDWLEGVDLNGFYASSAPPMTDDKRNLIGVSGKRDELTIAVRGQIKETPVVNVTTLKKSIEEEIPHASEAAIASILKSMACVSKRTRDKRLWITPLGSSQGLSIRSTPKELSFHIN
jgi:hypothetical protein